MFLTAPMDPCAGTETLPCLHALCCAQGTLPQVFIPLSELVHAGANGRHLLPLWKAHMVFPHLDKMLNETLCKWQHESPGAIF